MEVEKYWIHPEYNNNFFELGFDIALILLKKPLEFNLKVRPICLPNQREKRLESGKVGVLSGWGLLHNRKDLSYKLRKV